MSLISFEQAYSQWMELVEEFDINQDDEPMMAESWNNYTDGLCKDGNFNDLMYYHCPAWDEDMQDGEDTFNFLCDCLGFDPAVVAQDIEELREFLDESESTLPTWAIGKDVKVLSDLLDVYDDLT